jgi:hypothetical protein
MRDKVGQSPSRISESEQNSSRADALAHYANLIQGIRAQHPQAISFINPPIFEEPPELSQELTGGRVALSAHFYDGLTMLGKRRHLFNAVSATRYDCIAC